jgi:alpha-maltose-1-phosphate synthase
VRVALLTREYPPEVYGGAGVHVEHLAAALARAGTDVRVHAFGGPRDDPLVARSYPMPVSEGGPEQAAFGVLAVGVAMAAELAGHDVVHSHTWYANLAGHLAALAHDVPHVATTHSLEPLRPWKAEQLGGGYAVSSWCEQVALTGAAAVIAVSEGMRADVLRAYPAVEAARVHVVHNGIDPDAYSPRVDDDVLARHRIDPARPRVVFLGRITRQKGLTHLLDAAELLDPEALLVLLAGAPDTPEIAAEMRGRVASLRQRRDVVWVEEMLPRPDVCAVLTGAAAFVCPSVYEPFGLVNLEAMACGAPVVASATGGIPEIVVEGETGYLVELVPGDDPYGSPADPARFARELAERIDRLVQDPDLATRLGSAGRDRVVAQFSWSAVAERTLAVYRGL